MTALFQLFNALKYKYLILLYIFVAGLWERRYNLFTFAGDFLTSKTFIQEKTEHILDRSTFRSPKSNTWTFKVSLKTFRSFETIYNSGTVRYLLWSQLQAPDKKGKGSLI